MIRVLVVVTVLVLGLTTALTVKIRAQEAAVLGPPSGSGVIEGTEVDVSARIPARVKSVAVRKGATVAAGDVLVELDCAEPEARLAEVDARIAAAKAQALAARTQVEIAGRGRKAAEAAAAAASAKVKAVAAHEVAAQREADRVGNLGKFAPAARADQAKDALETLRHEKEAITAQTEATMAQAGAAGAQLSAAGAQADAAERSVEALLAGRRLVEIQAAECVLRAPRAGVVEDVHFEVGELVGPGSVLVRIVDLSEVELTFYLPNAELAEAKVGRKAKVTADAWPGESFDGEIVAVSSEAEFTPRNIQTRTDRDRLVYAIELRVAQSAGKLRPGMPAQVTLLGAGR